MKKLVAFILPLIMILSACGSRDETDEQELKRYLSLTEKASRAFEYEAVEDGRIKTTVGGEIEDDLRNSLIWSEDGQQILERRIIDDALAVRVITPAKLEVLASGPVGGSIIVGDALRSGRWVLDPGGAPPIVSRTSDPRRRTVGLDPPSDAVDIFKYLRRSIEESLGVFEFNKDSPNYRPDLDPFPHPQSSLGIKRFDLFRTTLPGRSSGGQRLPGVGAFRKMSFYVR
ncbi:MAG TPA: hypothetical protein VNA87_03800, partial [Actinomycetota bacterium]|nr:hypothetical protein [Actinomycetota bacterium]